MPAWLNRALSRNKKEGEKKRHARHVDSSLTHTQACVPATLNRCHCNTLGKICPVCKERD